LILCATVAVLVAAAASAKQSAAPGDNSSSASTSAAASAALPEVTIRAQRADLASKVSKFVDHITAPQNGGDGGLALWMAPPVCPLVSGLPRQEGEFILERLSEIARVASVPLAGEHCRPNLYILVTSQPEDLLRGMEKRNRSFTFGFDVSHSPATLTPTSVVDEFIAAPRPVRVWYNSVFKTPEGMPPSYNCPGAFPGVACNPHALASRLVLGLVRTFSTVFVVVDQRRLQGISRGQLADYVGMVGLAKLKPGARLGDTQTILKLFDPAPGAAPAGLTDWDQAFLKSLCTTEQASRLQRGQISRAMVREIVP
jgi:hypothetical protein